MLDRRSFLAATLGAATFPMPALARAALTLRVIAQRECRVEGQREWAVYPTLAATPGGKVAAMWGSVMDDGVDTYVQILTPTLSPRSKPVNVRGAGMVHHAVGMSRTGGVALTGVATGSTATPFTFDGALAGPEIQLTRRDARVCIYEPAVCTLADGSFMTAWRAESRDSSYFGAAGLVIGPDGRRRTGLFNLFKRYQHYGAWVFIEALVPAGDGAVVVGTLDERGGLPDGQSTTPRSMRMRRVGPRGQLGPVTEIATGFDWAVGGAVGLRDRVALFWCVGGTLYGGLYAPNGVCVRDFEPVPDVPPPVMRVASNKMLVPLGGGRLFNYAGLVVHDLSTGRVVARFDDPRENWGEASAAAALGHGRVAIANGNYPYLTTLAIE
ncbi:hypothetical protein [Oharaeibacter diazotrophicus]|uniref:Uncharacterized protein n=1 Tax=Oharaeibacter diazotrophicus TaxID=1920512 RepID=A0A4R6R8P3_9HYPH|nr:hypothetical protein [Oharaeibacter diazotrophicus]TDP81946.1 hypothetical protein EDD54_4207 [Oharaeibacter diazotrophicus]BBE73578.1 hypothetical protein OHA_1_03192 [Pleomorphomonas sp. SM30]GLS75368.1 hypothetical protein GCM10007904_07030 [Oharaeibacter diazotrophicus]